MRRTLRAWLVLPLLFISGVSFAEQRIEWLDEDADGRKETKVFYEGNTRVRAEADKNNDGKPDIFVEFKKNVRFKSTSDSDFDGVIDTWQQYDSAGNLKTSARDTNKDGKPDVFLEFLKGRNLVLRESDRNFDGKIDRRWLTQWDPSKRLMTGMSNNRPQYSLVPGYITLWAEEDNNFDGKIDAYTERGNQNPPKDRLGKPMEHKPA